ncbi:MAG: sulfite exporter TauE/SafE family protein [Betaproteobacteria bacterium]|nr:sulfite exporter TauE/SafE family protein [Betaproteobacteria bacterium]
MENFAFVLAGFVVGLIVGLTGVGGGSLMTPLLIFGFGIKPALAVGTDLLFASGTKFGGLLNFARQRVIPWRVVFSLSAGSVPAALLTLWALHEWGTSNPMVQRAITFTLGIALLLTAAATLYKAIRAPRRAEEVDDQSLERPADHAKHPLLPVLFGAVIGVLVTLTSVGAGAIGVTVLMLLYPQLPLYRIVAADIAYAVPLTLVAGLGHAALGTVDWSLLALLLTGSIPGIWLGSHLISRVPERFIRSALSVLLAWAGSKLVLI